MENGAYSVIAFGTHRSYHVLTTWSVIQRSGDDQHHVMILFQRNVATRSSEKIVESQKVVVARLTVCIVCCPPWLVLDPACTKRTGGLQHVLQSDVCVAFYSLRVTVQPVWINLAVSKRYCLCGASLPIWRTPACVAVDRMCGWVLVLTSVADGGNVFVWCCMKFCWPAWLQSAPSKVCRAAHSNIAYCWVVCCFTTLCKICSQKLLQACAAAVAVLYSF